MGNERYWNEKFKNRGEQILPPDKMLIEHINYLRNGSVIDIACGDGRNTFYLLKKGFTVTGIDFSEKALERLRYFANEENLSVMTSKVDLTHNDAFKNLGLFDNAVINHYRLNTQLLESLKHHIRQEGIVYISGFSEKHKTDSRIREIDLIQKSDIESMQNNFELIKYTETEDERGHFATYIFKRKR